MNDRKRIQSSALSIGFVVVFVIVFMLLSTTKQFFPARLERFSHGIIGTLAATGTVWLFLNFTRSSFGDIGLRWEAGTIRRFLVGWLVGVALALSMILMQIRYSGLEVSLSAHHDPVSFLLWSSALIPLAFMEELAFRSYPFVKLNRAFGLRITQIIMAVLFALYHVLNGWPLVLSFLGPGVWALVYGLAAMISDGISMPTGLHYGVNLVLAVVGSKSGIEGIWTVDVPAGASEVVLRANERFGMGLQIALLVLGIVGTELFVRARRAAANRVYVTGRPTR